MCFLFNSYKIPRVCVFLIGLGIALLLFGVADVATADDQTTATPHPQGQLDCDLCHSLSMNMAVVNPSLSPNLHDLCNICIATTQSEEQEDIQPQQTAEKKLHNALTDFVAFKSENRYFTNDSRVESIAKQLQIAQSSLRQGHIEEAMQLIDNANRWLDRLRIEAQRSQLINGNRMEQTTHVAAQTDVKSRVLSQTILSDQLTLLLDIDNLRFIVALKRQVGFTVRTEHVLHRRLPLSDEEGNVVFHFANVKQRLPVSNAQSLFCFTGRLCRYG